MRKVNIAFTCIFTFVGCALLYICINFGIKYFKYNQFNTQVLLKNAHFYFDSDAEGKSVVYAKYVDLSQNEVQVPLLIKGRVCKFTNEKKAQEFVQELNKGNWVAYTSAAGQISISKPKPPVKEAVYAFLCIAIAIYFYMLRVKVRRML